MQVDSSSDEDPHECKICNKLATEAFSCNIEGCGKVICGPCAKVQMEKFGGKCPFCLIKGKLKPCMNIRMSIDKEKVLCKECDKKFRRYNLLDHQEKYCQGKIQEKPQLTVIEQLEDPQIEELAIEKEPLQKAEEIYVEIEEQKLETLDITSKKLLRNQRARQKKTKAYQEKEAKAQAIVIENEKLRIKKLKEQVFKIPMSNIIGLGTKSIDIDPNKMIEFKMKKVFSSLIKQDDDSEPDTDTETNKNSKFYSCSQCKEQTNMFCNNCVGIYYCKVHKKDHKKECPNKFYPDLNKKILHEGVAQRIEDFSEQFPLTKKNIDRSIKMENLWPCYNHEGQILEIVKWKEVDPKVFGQYELEEKSSVNFSRSIFLDYNQNRLTITCKHISCQHSNTGTSIIRKTIDHNGTMINSDYDYNTGIPIIKSDAEFNNEGELIKQNKY